MATLFNSLVKAARQVFAVGIGSHVGRLSPRAEHQILIRSDARAAEVRSQCAGRGRAACHLASKEDVR